MTASKAYMQERKARKSLTGGEVFIKLEVVRKNGSRCIFTGNFALDNHTHIEAKTLAKYMIANGADTQ